MSNNCKLSFTCSLKWNQLKTGTDASVRRCPACKTDVFAVYSESEFEQHKAQGHCVAMFFDGPEDLMGMPDYSDGWDLDPILYLSVQELEELPRHTLRNFEGHGLVKVGDIVGLTETKALELLQGSRAELCLLRDALAARGLTFGMRLDGWTPL